jgi:hypothetical protein
MPLSAWEPAAGEGHMAEVGRHVKHRSRDLATGRVSTPPRRAAVIGPSPIMTANTSDVAQGHML